MLRGMASVSEEAGILFPLDCSVTSSFTREENDDGHVEYKGVVYQYQATLKLRHE